MTNTPEQQALLKRLLGRLLLKNHDLKATSYDQPEVAADRLVLLRLDNLTDTNHDDLEAFMAEHEAEDFSFGDFAEGSDDPKDWTKATRFYTLLLGAKADRQSLGEDEVAETKQRDLWRFGTIRHNGTIYTYEAKVYDVGSRYGIKGGRISKLFIKERLSQKPVLHYDRGWDIRPKTAVAKALISTILAFYKA